MSKLLINENPLIVLPSLVKRLGGNYTAAIILQQVHFMCQQPRSGVEHEGYKWVWFTYDQFVDDYMPWLSPLTIRNTIRKLEAEGLLLSTTRVNDQWDNTKFYRVNGEALDGTFEGTSQSIIEGTVEGTFNETANGTFIYRTKTSTKISSDEAQNDPLTDADFAAQVLAENYANPVPGWAYNLHRNTQVALDDFFDAHAAIVSRYGRAAYVQAIQACIADEYRDGRKADHVEHHVKLAQVDGPKRDANGRVDYRAINNPKFT